jgi:hypothetical protein
MRGRVYSLQLLLGLASAVHLKQVSELCAESHMNWIPHAVHAQMAYSSSVQRNKAEVEVESCSPSMLADSSLWPYSSSQLRCKQPEINTTWRNSLALSPQANYTDCATATWWRNLIPTFADRGVSGCQGDRSPMVINLSFLDWSRYFSFK